MSSAHLPPAVLGTPNVCPSGEILALLGERWTIPLITQLRLGPQRNGELKAKLAEISSKELAKKLRALEKNGLVARTVSLEARPRVTYALTPLGRTLEDELERLDAWVRGHLSALTAARAGFKKLPSIRNPWQVPRVR